LKQTSTIHEAFDETEKKQYPEIFPANTSTIFKLMRNLMAYSLLCGDTMALGNLSIHWPFNQYSISEVFEKECLAFEQLCLINKWPATENDHSKT
jgi:hypothetical protein